MDKRYQVFVSSTYKDLIDERQEVVRGLLEFRCFPCGMEYFPAANEETWQLIQRLIDGCDYYVLIIGGRYGSTTPEGISYTEKEYRYARDKGIPTIAFYHATPEALPANKTERSEEGQRRLEAFLSDVKRNACREWKTPHDLRALVVTSLVQLIEMHPRPGWVRSSAPNAPGMESIQEKPQRSVPQLSEGDDTVELTLDRKTGPYGLGGPQVVSVTWNDLLWVVGAELEKGGGHQPEVTVLQAIDSYLTKRFEGPFISTDMNLQTDSRSIIRNQFRALRYIQVRDQNGPGTFWTATQKGEDAFLVLKAKKRT
jgi:hypothetical protein